jgi:hypothetical protein
MLGIRQCEQVRKLSAQLDDAVELVVRPGRDAHPLTDSLEKLARTLSSLAQNLNMRLDREAAVEIPHLQVLSKRNGALYYAALPLDHEWDPFLRTLQAAGSATAPTLPEDIKQILDSLSAPTKIEVFITPVCPYCGQAVERVNRLALVSAKIESWIIDAFQFMDLARKRGIRSTPTLTVDGEPRWVGAVSDADLLRILAPQGRSSWTLVLQSLIASGQLEDATATIQSHPESAWGLIDPLTASDFSARLTAMRVLQETASRDSEALGGITLALCDLLKHQDARVRGDVAYALGMIGDPRAHDPLMRLLKDDDPDVREAAQEALDAL